MIEEVSTGSEVDAPAAEACECPTQKGAREIMCSACAVVVGFEKNF